MEALGERYVIQETLFEGEGAHAWVGLDLEAGELVVVTRLRADGYVDDLEEVRAPLEALPGLVGWRLAAAWEGDLYLVGDYDPERPFTSTDALALLEAVTVLSALDDGPGAPGSEVAPPPSGGLTLIQLMIFVAVVGLGAGVLIPLFADVEEPPPEVEDVSEPQP